ncbi:hypothetical protein Ato02nite_075320 [Paractinoplanes toevensis]|uniref:G5 domain-containing protein n=2 Tax=Paractinoplanes toevensis TaxID=571911 RepID=A0A919W8V7_9ACTN|nr:hypothetical protein Ato02nite_075320 [Actinoplanes toevensis]
MAVGASALLIVVGGGAAGVAAFTMGGDQNSRIVTEAGQAAVAAPAMPQTGGGAAAVRPPVFGRHAAPVDADARGAKPADRTATRDPGGYRPPPRSATGTLIDPPPAAAAPRAAVAPPAARPGTVAAPVTTIRTEVETREIPFETRLVRDPGLPRGEKRIEAPGVPGVETLRYQVTVTDGRTVARDLIDATVTQQPQHRIVAFGTQRFADRDPECGRGLHVCVPLGRDAGCPESAETGVVGLGGSVTVLDSDVALLAEIPELAC